MFEIDVNTNRRMDLYSESILFEFKYRKNLGSLDRRAEVIAQTLYYIRNIKYGNEELSIPPYICGIEQTSAFFVETKKLKKIYDSKNKSYDWDRAPSTPCPRIVDAVKKIEVVIDAHVYDFCDKNEWGDFCDDFIRKSQYQVSFTTGDYDKKHITENNFEKAFDTWQKMFGPYVKNGRKTSEYFVSDIQEGRSFPIGSQGEIGFAIGANEIVRKPMPEKEYRYFWNMYARCNDLHIIQKIWQRLDRLTVEDYRRFTGEFYTPIEIAQKALSYIGKAVGSKWWEKGYRLWDMAAGTGNLEYYIPEEALKYCYISTLLEDDVRYCSQIYKSATVFQYDYLNDDIDLFFGSNQQNNSIPSKLPHKLRTELSDPDIKWIIFINPPFATANTAQKKKGKSKDDVSMTRARYYMTVEEMGETSRELFAQFIWRISREFAGKECHLGLFSTLKYLLANNDQLLRDNYFRYKFCSGFCMPSSLFKGNTGEWPVGFLVWDLRKSKSVEEQKIMIDIFNDNVEKIGKKEIVCRNREGFLSKWVERPRTTHIRPPMSNWENVKHDNKDIRDKAADGFLASLMACGNDIQHQNNTALLSSPYASAGGFSIVQQNFEKAFVTYAVRVIPKATWLNDRDQYMQPIVDLDQEFIDDCIVWSLFSNGNNTTSLTDVVYKGNTYQIINELFPFKISEVKKWKIDLPVIQNSILAANRDRYMAEWLGKKKLSKEAKEVMKKAKVVYRFFFEHTREMAWPRYKISRWDCGWMQIKQSLADKRLATNEMEALFEKNEELKRKIYPQIYDYGFLQGKEIYFEEI